MADFKPTDIHGAEIKTLLNRDPATGKPILEISHSGLNAFASCPKKWAFNKAIVHFNQTRESGDAASVGTALHAGIQSYAIHRDLERAMFDMAMEHPIDLRENTAKASYSLEAATHTLLECIKDGKLDDYDLATFVKDGVSVPAVEIAFLVRIELEHIVVHLRGFIDLVMVSMITQRFMAVDIKTTTPQGASNFREKYQHDWQTTSYGIPLQGLLGLEGSFDTAIMGVVLSDREPKFPFEAFKRTADDVDDYYHYLDSKCQQIQRFWLEQRFPREPKGCYNFNRLCHYHTECNIRMLPQMQVHVNPTGKRGADPRPFNPVFTAELNLCR